MIGVTSNDDIIVVFGDRAGPVDNTVLLISGLVGVACAELCALNASVEFTLCLTTVVAPCKTSGPGCSKLD